jgi:hypothetical protein
MVESLHVTIPGWVLDIINANADVNRSELVTELIIKGILVKQKKDKTFKQPLVVEDTVPVKLSLARANLILSKRVEAIA